VAEEIEGQEPSAAASSAGVNPAAISLALGAAAQNEHVAAEAETFLEKQGALSDEQRQLTQEQKTLVRLQAKELALELGLRHWSLRVRHFSDLMKLSFEFAVAFIVLAIATFIAAVVWSAAHDDGLVIEAFSVPPDLAARGLTGQVVATQFQDRLSSMQANTDSIRAVNTFRNNWGDDVKVQIPDTGVSVGEFYRYLASWIGNQTFITGEVYHGAKGLTVSARAGSEAAQTYSGADADLDVLVTKAAENVYAQTQPYRYAAFLFDQGRLSESMEVARSLALKGPLAEKPWAYSFWGIVLGNSGDNRGAAEMERIAARQGPGLGNVFFNLAIYEAALGHDEAELLANRRALELFQSPHASELASYAVAIQIPMAKILVAGETGDYSSVSMQVGLIEALPDYGHAHVSSVIEMANDLAENHDVAASRRADGWDTKNDGYAIHGMRTVLTDVDLIPLPVVSRAIALDDWNAARDDLIADDNLPNAKGNLPDLKRLDFGTMLRVFNWPWLAVAHAKLGEFASAHALIDRTPDDCYLCLRARGMICAAEKRWGAAAWWFARAATQGPSLPFADAEWGTMLMAKGDYSSAIAKFRRANAQSPHFADPLEMWGEALMLKNRSDLALAKFEEANKYAPNWGRLHLKWGQALFYAGRKEEARKQFATATYLDLSAADKAALTRVRAMHG
jgi:tetratricopeptide (TPR) repeat protein